MGRKLNEKWTAYVVGQMHRYNITNQELAERIGVTPSYLSTVLNCRKKFESEKAYDKTKYRIYTALQILTTEIQEGKA